MHFNINTHRLMPMENRIILHSLLSSSLVNYVVQPVVAEGSKIAFYEILGRVKDVNDGVFMQAINKGKKELIDGLKHLNSFAKTLGKKTVIEHIENEALLLAAYEVGADYLQADNLVKPFDFPERRV